MLIIFKFGELWKYLHLCAYLTRRAFEKNSGVSEYIIKMRIVRHCCFGVRL